MTHSNNQFENRIYLHICQVQNLCVVSVTSGVNLELRDLNTDVIGKIILNNQTGDQDNIISIKMCPDNHGKITPGSKPTKYKNGSERQLISFTTRREDEVCRSCSSSSLGGYGHCFAGKAVVKSRSTKSRQL